MNLPSFLRDSIINRSRVEWKDHTGRYPILYNCNIYVGCGHDCRYCYARLMTKRFLSAFSWRDVHVVENADALIKQGLAKAIPSPAAPEPSTFEIRGKDGSQLAIAESTPKGVTIEPTVSVKADLPVFKSFLVQRVLIPLTEKHGGKYRLDADSEGCLTEISLEGLKLDEKLIKELTGAVRWTLERAVEKAGGSQT